MFFSHSDEPPSPSTPYPIEVSSTWVTLGWYELECDGGHRITELVVRYRKQEVYFIVTSYDYIYNVDPSRRNYTVLKLDPETAYAFSVQALSDEFEESDFSEERIISTLVAGRYMYTCMLVHDGGEKLS